MLEKYLDGEQLSADEITSGFRQAVWSKTFVPVFVSAGTAGIGAIPILEAIVQLFPSPAHAPPRVAQSKGKEIEIESVDSGPLAAYVWKTTADPFVGRLTYLRVLSGVLSSDSRTWNRTRREAERIGTLQLLRGKEQIPTKNLHAGDIGVIAKLNETQTGDTLSEKINALTVGSPAYPNALYSVAVVPKTQADAAKISSVLSRLSEEDPYSVVASRTQHQSNHLARNGRSTYRRRYSEGRGEIPGRDTDRSAAGALPGDHYQSWQFPIPSQKADRWFRPVCRSSYADRTLGRGGNSSL